MPIRYLKTKPGGGLLNPRQPFATMGAGLREPLLFRTDRNVRVTDTASHRQDCLYYRHCDSTGKVDFMSDTTSELADNPLLATEGLPDFARIEPSHVVPAVRHLLATSLERLEALEANIQPTWEGVIEALEGLDRPFEHAWQPVSHLFGVKNSPELREAYETVLGEIVEFGLRASQSEPIYRAIKELRDGEVWNTLSPTRKRIVEKKLLDAELSGIALSESDRERFNEIAGELSQLSTDFSNHVLDATKAFSLVIEDPQDAEGLPSSLRQLAAQSYNESQQQEEGGEESAAEATPESGPWRITLDHPSFGPFLQHCCNRNLRERVYRAFITRAAEGEFDNSDSIPKILSLRVEKAKLLGYEDFAAVSLATKMAENVAAVEQMFETLRSASWNSAVQDLDDLKQLATASGCEEPLAHWDVAFWAERLRETRFDFTDEQLRPYFSLERVLDGLFSLVNRLFGITVESVADVSVWNDDVRFFNIHNEAGEHVASFYLDPYSRPENKRGGAWMDECLSRRIVDGSVQLPVAQLVCNSTPPVGDKPSLMTFREVETLFHEFGHGLQHMLTTVDEADASGISGVEWDAVELPSQFMENWCYHKPTLLGMAAHFETGEPLPDDLFQKILAARTYRAGSMMLRQLLFGMTDMALHHGYDPDGDETVFSLHERMAEKTSVLPMRAEDRTLCAFQHIFAGGYCAGYYSYKWAEVLSADAFGAFEDAGLDNERAVSETGRQFRDTILSAGGGRHPMELFKAFRGREPSPEALLRHNGLS
jgi:oligopeptidase A